MTDNPHVSPVPWSPVLRNQNLWTRNENFDHMEARFFPASQKPGECLYPMLVVIVDLSKPTQEVLFVIQCNDEKAARDCWNSLYCADTGHVRLGEPRLELPGIWYHLKAIFKMLLAMLSPGHGRGTDPIKEIKGPGEN